MDAVKRHTGLPETPSARSKQPAGHHTFDATLQDEIQDERGEARFGKSWILMPKLHADSSYCEW